MRVGPMPSDAAAMPPQQRVRRDEEHRPTLPFEDAAQPREHQPIPWFENQPADLPSQNLDLLAEHEDLDVFRPIAATAQHEQLDNPTEQRVRKRHDRQPRGPRPRTTNAQVNRPIKFSAPICSGTPPASSKETTNGRWRAVSHNDDLALYETATHTLTRTGLQARRRLRRHRL